MARIVLAGAAAAWRDSVDSRRHRHFRPDRGDGGKAVGAGRVIAAGRNRETLARAERLGADVSVDLVAATDLAAAHRDAAGGTADVIIDYLCGKPGEAALDAVSTFGRFVHVGSSAGATMTISGAATRRTCVDIMGFAYYHAPVEAQAEAYAELCRLAAAGALALDTETRPLAEIGAAWDAHAATPRRRQVLDPEA